MRHCRCSRCAQTAIQISRSIRDAVVLSSISCKPLFIAVIERVFALRWPPSKPNLRAAIYDGASTISVPLAHDGERYILPVLDKVRCKRAPKTLLLFTLS